MAERSATTPFTGPEPFCILNNHSYRESTINMQCIVTLDVKSINQHNIS